MLASLWRKEACGGAEADISRARRDATGHRRRRPTLVSWWIRRVPPLRLNVIASSPTSGSNA